MQQALSRRFSHETWPMPDILFIDGGLGQLHEAERLFMQLAKDATDIKQPLLIGVAKGEGRKEGLETLITGWEHHEIKYHHRCNRPFPHGMRNIKTLHSIDVTDPE